mgnify:FL=1
MLRAPKTYGMMIPQLREDIGDRLCVQRGNEATGNHNYSDSIFIYKHGTDKHNRVSYALKMRFELFHESKRDEITKEYYDYYKGIRISRYVDGNHNKKYNNEVEFFYCSYTKHKLKELLS